MSGHTWDLRPTLGDDVYHPPGVPHPPLASLGKTAPYSGAILPFKVNESGEAQFDSDAGLLGAIKRGFMLAGDVWSGKVDPTSQGGIERAVDMAGLAMTGGLGGASVAANESALGATYFRRTRGPHPDNGAGYMMFADDLANIGSYGRNAWSIETDSVPLGSIIDAGGTQFKKKSYRAFRGTESREDARKLVEGLQPPDIVNSAGTWDSHDKFVPLLWEQVLEPNGWTVIKTQNGVITFDPSYVRPVSN